MAVLSYRLDESIGEFEAGDVLEVTARFEAWHPSDVKLTPTNPSAVGSVELTWEELRSISEPVGEKEAASREFLA
jgi:hypothetical protein